MYNQQNKILTIFKFYYILSERSTRYKEIEYEDNTQ